MSYSSPWSCYIKCMRQQLKNKPQTCPLLLKPKSTLAAPAATVIASPHAFAISVWRWHGGKGEVLPCSVTSSLEKWLVASPWMLSSFCSRWRITSMTSQVSAGPLKPSNSFSAMEQKSIFLFETHLSLSSLLCRAGKRRSVLL